MVAGCSAVETSRRLEMGNLLRREGTGGGRERHPFGRCEVNLERSLLPAEGARLLLETVRTFTVAGEPDSV